MRLRFGLINPKLLGYVIKKFARVSALNRVLEKIQRGFLSIIRERLL